MHCPTDLSPRRSGGGGRLFGVTAMIFNDTVGFYTKREVCRMTKYSPRSLYRYVKKGLFPLPVPLSKRRKVWWIPDVHQWFREQLGKPRK